MKFTAILFAVVASMMFVGCGTEPDQASDETAAVSTDMGQTQDALSLYVCQLDSQNKTTGKCITSNSCEPVPTKSCPVGTLVTMQIAQCGMGVHYGRYTICK